MSRNRIVRVAAVSQADLPWEPRERLIEYTLERAQWATADRPEIVCLPECWTGTGPEDVPGPLTERVADWARAHGCHVICPIRARIGGALFNSAIVIDRTGAPAGRYDKIHPTENELADGVAPAAETDPPVFALDGVTIGVQTCFDVNWREPWRRLKEKGAQVVFFVAAYPAASQVAALAWANEYYVVAASRSRACSVYDISGRVIERSGPYQPWAFAALGLGKRLFEIDFHVKKARAIEAKYGDRVRIEWFHDEDWLTLDSLDPDLAVEDLIAEFDLTPLRDYIARCERAIAGARGRR